MVVKMKLNSLFWMDRLNSLRLMLFLAVTIFPFSHHFRSRLIYLFQFFICNKLQIFSFFQIKFPVKKRKRRVHLIDDFVEEQHKSNIGGVCLFILKIILITVKHKIKIKNFKLLTFKI